MFVIKRRREVASAIFKHIIKMLNILLFKSILRQHEVATATFKHIFKMLNILLFKSIERQHKVETTIFKHIVTMLNILLFRRLTPQSMEGTLFMRRRWKQNSPTNILLFKGTVCQNVVTTVLKILKFSSSSKLVILLGDAWLLTSFCQPAITALFDPKSSPNRLGQLGRGLQLLSLDTLNHLESFSSWFWKILELSPITLRFSF